MSKKNKYKIKNPASDPEFQIHKAAVIKERQIKGGSGFSPRFPYIFLLILSCLIYSNTIWNDYANDDTIVLTENNFTKKGFDGIKDLMTHDAFEGFFGDRGSTLIQGGRYRPLSLVSLAIEYQFWKMMQTPTYPSN